MRLRTGKAGPLLKPAQYLRGLLPQSHETSRDLSFTISGRQVGVSCIIKCPVTGVNPNLFCSLTRLCFGAPAFVSPRLSFLRARQRASPGGCGQRDVEVTFRPGPWEPPPLERIGWRPKR